MKTDSALAQLIRFTIVGLFTACIDFGLTYTLTHVAGWDRVNAKIIGWCAGTATAYVLNSRYTFKAELTAKRAWAVFILYATTFAIQVGLFKLTNAPLIALGFEDPWKDTISFVIAQGVATITNFVLQRVLIFKDAGNLPAHPSAEA
ncbi:GtrA family protein [Corynebacterium aquatimens]|uniref:Flippase GtrA n=1 Tax=Corynebacterium aquatimens TaxID=1190508 RepID=A0A931GS26_9CORY|nr:GtrA family protein [Corynebacterium aquatimens]MBG6122593.1 putative flippase GtrA [Corynebacterium aquatimens]WJY64867.1 GtrA-like protein [Corynebacterium aquatimens]